MHAPSGAGKTSLLRAKLIPELREKGYATAPIIRVGLEPKGSADRPGGNRYVESLMASLQVATGKEGNTGPDGARPNSVGVSGSSLDARIRLLEPTWEQSRAPGGQSDPGRDSTRGLVLIFDQFEEILSIDPIDLDAKRAFFEELGAALREDRGLWALFAMREDYVASLDPFLTPMPRRLQVRFRLDLLDEKSAGLAISKPIEVAGASIEPDAVSYLVDELRKVRFLNPRATRTGDAGVVEVLGPHVEPVQLQVVCENLWSRWRTGSPDSKEITREVAGSVASIDRALEDYYLERVAKVARLGGGDDLARETRIRKWIAGELITPSGVRGVVLKTPGRTQGLDNGLIDGLIAEYLIRSERRRGEDWIELVHDRLIEPIRNDNARWFRENLSSPQLQAMAWDRQGEPDALLLRGDELAKARQWARGRERSLDEVDRRFLDESISAFKGGAWLKYQVARNWVFASPAVLGVLLWYAWIQSISKTKAEIKRDEAEASATRVLGEKDREARDYQRALTWLEMLRKQPGPDKAQQLDHGVEKPMNTGSLVFKSLPDILETSVPEVYLDKAKLVRPLRSRGDSFNVMELYRNATKISDFPLLQVDQIANSFVRLAYQKPSGQGASLGTSVQGSPSFRLVRGGLYLRPKVGRADVRVGADKAVTNRMEAVFVGIADVSSSRSFPDPEPGRTVAEMSYVMTPTNEMDLDLDAERRNKGDVFRFTTLSSMFTDDRVYDANVLIYEDFAGKMHTLRIDAEQRGAYLFPEAVEVGHWFELVKEPGSLWFPDSPSIRVDIVRPEGDHRRIGIQGLMDRTLKPNEDSLTVWVEWMDVPNRLDRGKSIDFRWKITATPPRKLEIPPVEAPKPTAPPARPSR